MTHEHGVDKALALYMLAINLVGYAHHGESIFIVLTALLVSFVAAQSVH